MHYFRGAAAFVVVGDLDVLGLVPVDVDPALVLVGVEHAKPAGTRGIVSIRELGSKS